MPLGFFDFETPSFWGLELVLLFRMPDLLVACFDECFDFIVEVREGAILVLSGGRGRWKRLMALVVFCLAAIKDNLKILVGHANEQGLVGWSAL